MTWSSWFGRVARPGCAAGRQVPAALRRVGGTVFHRSISWLRSRGRGLAQASPPSRSDCRTVRNRQEAHRPECHRFLTFGFAFRISESDKRICGLLRRVSARFRHALIAYGAGSPNSLVRRGSRSVSPIFPPQAARGRAWQLTIVRIPDGPRMTAITAILLPHLGICLQSI